MLDGVGPSELPPRIGPYRVIDYLGEGAMGDVFLAERELPMRQRVALKLIKRGRDTREMLKRFELERQALAIMEHGSIAKVFDAGETEDGRPYFAMEYVKGIPLTDYCDKHRLSLSARLELFCKVCEGVQHAHQKGVMHRDLKPSNVLVSIEGNEPVPKIIDFGLARATDLRNLQSWVFTEHGMLIGTPEYMSPEQAGLDNLDIDTRTDVYSLGVMLYELLVGTLPFAPKELRAAGYEEIRRRIREDDPPRPSTKLSALGGYASDIAEHRRLEPRELVRTLEGELDWVILKAMEKDRTRRYETPGGLAEELRRFLENEPVGARPPSLAYRARKFVRRYRLQVIAAAAVLMTLVAGIVGTSIGFVNARANAERLARSNRFLGYIARLRDLSVRERELYPAWPENVEVLDNWVDSAEVLLSAYSELKAERTRLRASLSTASDPASRFLLRSLDLLLDVDLHEFTREGGPLDSVRRRLQWATTIERRSITDHADRWKAAIAAIRTSERYAGLGLEPQVGLVPLGPNDFDLWEFYHLRSAGPDEPIPFEEAPKRSGPPNENWGIVFVLLPGGEVTLGAQNEDPAGDNYDSAATADSSLKLQRVTLPPFFLAKYELTRTQWLRLRDEYDPRFSEDPSYNRVDQVLAGQRITGVNPIEWVSWRRGSSEMAKHGLTFPTEMQWEYACRAGTDTVYFTGDAPESMEGYCNVADETYLRHVEYSYEVFFDDGHYKHSPVGSFEPNAFGLYDMLGNVFEFVGEANEKGVVTLRGGSFRYPLHYYARCSYRHRISDNLTAQNTGMRPARELITGR